jgi:hypothetical protein
MTATDPTRAGAPAETKRGRVRRLLLDPLGFRFPRGTDPEEAKARLNRIADDLAYLDDRELGVLRECLQSKGEGSAKCFWPDFGTFRGFAEALRPRPLEELPEMRSWFGSVEGPRARQAGTLVETWLFIEAKKRPPYLPADRDAIARKAAEHQRRLRITADRKARGVFDPARFPQDRDDAAFEEWHRARRAYLDEVVTILSEQKDPRP